MLKLMMRQEKHPLPSNFSYYTSFVQNSLANFDIERTTPRQVNQQNWNVNIFHIKPVIHFPQRLESSEETVNVCGFVNDTKHEY